MSERSAATAANTVVAIDWVYWYAGGGTSVTVTGDIAG